MVNEEKIFGLLEKMYVKVTGLEEGQKSLEVEQRKLNQTIARMEVENHHKFGALFDGHKSLLDGQKALFEQVSQNTELLNQHSEILNQHSKILDRHTGQLDRLENKVDGISIQVGSHDVQIKLLKK